MLTKDKKTGIKWTALAALAAAVMFGGSAFGWGELSHIIINKQAGVITENNEGVLEAYGELPDAWPSFDAIPFTRRIPRRISSEFTWGHNVQKQSRSWYRPWMPRRPEYQNKAHEPGANMLYLVNNKFAAPPGENAEKTALAFSRHNAADGAVHFDYFEGGSLRKWIQHGLKEKWADYELYVKYLTCSENPVFPPKNIDVGYKHEEIDLKLIQLSQKIFLKNRLSTTEGECGTTHTIDVESIGDIQQRMIAAQNRKQGGINDMSSWKRDAYLAQAFTFRWNAESMFENEFIKAVNAVIEVEPE